MGLILHPVFNGLKALTSNLFQYFNPLSFLGDMNGKLPWHTATPTFTGSESLARTHAKASANDTKFRLSCRAHLRFTEPKSNAHQLITAAHRSTCHSISSSSKAGPRISWLVSTDVLAYLRLWGLSRFQGSHGVLPNEGKWNNLTASSERESKKALWVAGDNDKEQTWFVF